MLTQTEGPNITNYWQYLSMDRDPFTMNAEEALIYLPAFWEEILDLTQYLLNYKNQIVVITGNNGIGKTVMQNLLSNQISEGTHFAKISAEPNLDAMRFIEFLSDSFMVPWQPEQNIEQVLDNQLEAFQYKNKNCVLIIDNAQLLPTETLEALLYLIGQQSETQMRFHVTLFGEPAVQQTLLRMLESDEEDLVHFLTLESLSLEETQQYLNYRLSASGWTGANPMTEEVIARIYRLSEGNPARINRIARRFLLEFLTEQEHAAHNKSWLKKHSAKILGALLIVLALMILSIWVWHSNIMNINHVIQKAPHKSPPKITINGQAALIPVSTDVVVAPNPESKPATNLAAKPAAETQPQVNLEPKPAAETQPQVNLVAKPAVEAQPQANLEPKPAVEAKPEATLKAEAKSSAKPAAKLEPTPKPDTHPKKNAIVPKQSKIKSPTKASYAIQLLNTKHKDSLAQCIKNHHLENKIYTRKVNGTLAVYHGHYKTMHDAEQALTLLPDCIENAGAWLVKIL